MNYHNLTSERSVVFNRAELKDTLVSVLDQLFPHQKQGVLFCKYRNRVVADGTRGLYYLTEPIPGPNSIMPAELFADVQTLTEPVDLVIYGSKNINDVIVSDSDVFNENVVCHIPNEYRADELLESSINAMIDSKLRYTKAPTECLKHIHDFILDHGDWFYDPDTLSRLTTYVSTSALDRVPADHALAVKLLEQVDYIYSKVFMATNTTIIELLKGSEWNIVAKNHHGDLTVITKYKEDYRAMEYMRLYGHLYK